LDREITQRASRNRTEEQGQLFPSQSAVDILKKSQEKVKKISSRQAKFYKQKKQNIEGHEKKAEKGGEAGDSNGDKSSYPPIALTDGGAVFDNTTGWKQDECRRTPAEPYRVEKRRGGEKSSWKIRKRGATSDHTFSPARLPITKTLQIGKLDRSRPTTKGEDQKKKMRKDPLHPLQGTGRKNHVWTQTPSGEEK